MKKITLLILLLITINFGYGQMSDLIISEYGEGSGNNKYVEIFNGTGADVDLTDYQIWRVSNGGVWPEVTISPTGTLPSGGSYLISNSSANATILAAADLTTGSANWNGDDAVGLAKDDGTGTFFLIDAVGTDGADPGTGWSVAGTTNATVNHTLIRKTTVCDPNTNWVASAGTSVADSEWTVLGIDNWADLGTHTTGCCIYSSTWTLGAWTNGIPDINTNVVINDTYIVGNSVNEVSFAACSLTINSGVILIVDNGTYIEVENDVTVDGTLRVETQGNFVQNDNSGSFTLGASGTANVNKVTPAKQDWLHYTYWSSPVENWTIADAFPNTPPDRRFWFRASTYEDLDADDIDDNNDAWQYTSGTDIMLAGVGYAATAGPFHIPGGTDSADFSGVFNTGNISTSISYNALNTLGSWNFIGNPYPSAIDFVAFQAANSTVIDGAAYFWSQASPPLSTNPGNQVQNFNQNDYAVYTIGSGGVAGGTTDIPTQYIPSAQGFFIAGLSNGTVTFTNSMRMADGSSNTLFFKKC